MASIEGLKLSSLQWKLDRESLRARINPLEESILVGLTLRTAN